MDIHTLSKEKRNYLELEILIKQQDTDKHINVIKITNL